jgi:hypothetical protein
MAVIDEYLSAIFLEVRMMANYFRRGYGIFESTSDNFARFDYLITRHLPEGGESLLEPWRRGFVLGLKKASEQNNLYIAAVFHNILATYYLNRASASSAYQLKRLRERVVYIDTNVLYALRVEASSYHELVEYLVRNLKRLGVSIKVFPFTVEEYETSLEAVEREFVGRKPSAQLVRWNPWLYQEFMLRPGRYMNSISACRQVHRIRPDAIACPPEAYDSVDTVLAENGLSLERDFSTLKDEDVAEKWSEYGHKMPSNTWSLDDYWEFLYRVSTVPLAKQRHDVFSLVNVGHKALAQVPDGLGPKTLFLTLDRNRLLRLRKVYRYIAGAEQLLEFFLPYFFLSDIPLRDADKFPNDLLAAQLGTLLVRRPPKIAEVVEAYVRDSRVFESGTGVRVAEIEAVATAMSDSRFAEIVSSARNLPIEQADIVRGQFGETLEQIKQEEIRSFYERSNEQLELERLKAQLSESQAREKTQQAQNQKLQRRVNYWKGQAKPRKD